MKNIALSLLIIFISSCSTMQISYDYDKQADFTKYKTYGFSKETMEMKIDQLNRERIVNAINREMILEGFTKSENPDVVVDVHVNVTKEVQATATSSGMGYGGYGYSHYGYGGGFTTTQIDYNTYYEGTLFINFVDRATEKIFWQGRGTKTIDQTATPEEREYNINKAVKDIFTKYPPYQRK